MVHYSRVSRLCDHQMETSDDRISEKLLSNGPSFPPFPCVAMNLLRKSSALSGTDEHQIYVSLLMFFFFLSFQWFNGQNVCARCSAGHS